MNGERKSPLSYSRRGLSLILGKPSLTGIGTSCPGWSYHPWRCSKNANVALGMGFISEHAGAGLVVDDSTLDVFSNLNNCLFCSLN